MAKPKTTNKLKNEVYGGLLLVGALAFFVIGGLAYWAHQFTGNMVHTELAAQKIHFPEKGSPEFDAATYPDIQKYAGQLVDTPEEAKAYANSYIGRHLQKVAGGKVYAEVSAESKLNPEDKKLQAQKQTLFQGETLRSVLLTSGYGFGTIGKVAGLIAFASTALGGLMTVLAFTYRTRK